ncbi:MAG: carboxy terminal-processing peptidase [Planctomycetota bacterium]
MKNRSLWLCSAAALLLAFLVLSVPVSGEDEAGGVLAPREDHPLTAGKIVGLLEGSHHRDQELDDAVSGRLLDRYLKGLDPVRLTFLASDVAEFEAFRTRLDDEIEAGKLGTAYRIFNRLQQRRVERLGYMVSLVDAGLDELDLAADESLDVEREDADWPADAAAAQALWRKVFKADVLTLLLAGRTKEDVAKTLGKRYSEQIHRAKQVRSRDVFSAYMNALTATWDPHTSYFPPRDAKNFDIRMKLSLTGIGALLTVDGDYVKVEELIAGGPAEKAGELKAGDRISGVAQGDDGEIVDTVAWRLDEVVDLIRGPKGSVVRLEILPAAAGAGGKPKIIRIVRDVVKLEDQAAKSRMIEVTRTDAGGKEVKVPVGVIFLPTFYVDLEAARQHDPNFRSSSRDVAKLIQELTDAGAQGIVIDLRNNSGGSLYEAVELTGLFVGRRTAVQVKDADGESQVLMARKPAVYDGPLVVLVNRLSASASEIFAGAIQDYGRGLVVGGTTFGKGTVQTVTALTSGQLKLTRAQFYRVTGESTQQRGVVPDLALPGWFDPEEVGESALEESLPWDKIPAAVGFAPMDRAAPDLAVLGRESSRRREADADFAFFRARRSLLEESRKSTLVSLNFETREKERKAREKRLLDAENLWRKARGMEPVTEATSPTAPEFDPWAKEAAEILVPRQVLSSHSPETR